MHLHLPKPLHGWRAFVGEVGIIVLGVLIALGAEQFAMTIHQRQEARQADDIIRGELEFNLGRLQSRMQIRACVDRRIEEVQALLDRAATEPNIVTPTWISRPQFWTFHSSRWDAEAQAGRVALVEREKLSDYGIIYAQMHELGTEMMTEQADWAKLRTLEHLHRLDSAALFDLNATLQDARYRNWRFTLISSQVFQSAGSLKLHATPNRTAASHAICLPITVTRDAANRISPWSFGEP